MRIRYYRPPVSDTRLLNRYLRGQKFDLRMYRVYVCMYVCVRARARAKREGGVCSPLCMFSFVYLLF